VVQWAGVTRFAELRQLASALALLAVVLAGESCLNPRPEELPSTTDESSPRNPQMMGVTGNDPGIGGDDLPPDYADDADGMGQTPSIGEQPGTPGNMSAPPSGMAADAGAPGEGPPARDAGADGG
jgi:hypothetical protein